MRRSACKQTGTKQLLGLESLESRQLLAITDPLGDGSDGVHSQDLVFADVRSVGNVLDIIVQLAPGAFSATRSNVSLALDVDRNPATGFAGIDAALHDSAFMGTDFLLSISGTDRLNARLLEFTAAPNSFADRASVPVQYVENGVRMLLPLSAIHSYDGILNYKVLCQEQVTDTGSTGILDVMPNVGLTPATSVWVSGIGRPVFDRVGDDVPDIVSTEVREIAGEIDMTVKFAPGTYDPNKSNVAFSFDTDQNPWTGHPGVSASGTIDHGVLGAEFLLTTSGSDRTIARLLKYTGPPINTFSTVGQISIMHVVDGVRMRFPASLLQDDGRFNFKATSSEQTGPTTTSGLHDIVPNVGLPAATSIHTVPGDVNDDGAFDSGDLVSIFAAGKYETNAEASYAQGDWNGDGRFDTSDLVYAFAAGAYQESPLRDLAAERIEFSIVNQITPFRGDVEIRGYVANVGTLDFHSNAGQQGAYLYEIPLGGQPQLVAVMPFANLAPGEEILVSYSRPWDSSSPNEGEFPPSYRLMVLFDPDIYLDGNLLNDDAVNTNNRTDRNGSEVNDLFG